MPTESRTRSSGTSSGEPATLACVIRPGCSISDSTPPSDSPSVNTSVRPQTLDGLLLAAARPGRRPCRRSRRICLAATSWPGCVGQARVVARGETCGCAARSLGDPLGVGAVPVHPHGQRLDAAQHQPGVERAGDGAHRVLVEGQLVAELRRRRRPARRRRRRSGRPCTWWWSARRRRRRAPAAAAGRAWRTCCPRPAARRRSCATLGQRGDVGDAQQRVGGRLDPDHLGLPGGPRRARRPGRRGRPAS